MQQKNLLSASASIGNAVKSLNQVCRESDYRERSRAGLSLAQQMPDYEHKHEDIEGFTRQLAEKNRNIEDYTRIYVGALKQLRALPATAADKARTLALQSASDVERWATGVVVSDYEASRSGHAVPSSSEVLLQRCRTSASGARAVPTGKATPD